MSERKTIAIGALAELYQRTLTKAGVRMYVRALSELTDEQTERAADAAATKSKFMPTPAELIDFARTGGVSPKAQALVAFEELQAALTAGTSSGMKPLTRSIANQLGGFDVLYRTPLEEFNTWKRKEFIDAYTTLVSENPDRVAALCGPQSEIPLALKKLPTRQEIEQTEADNRRALNALERLESK